MTKRNGRFIEVTVLVPVEDIEVEAMVIRDSGGDDMSESFEVYDADIIVHGLDYEITEFDDSLVDALAIERWIES